MLNNFILNCLCVSLLISLNMCSSFENNIEEEEDTYNKHLDGRRANRKANEKIDNRIHSTEKNNNSYSDITVDYANDTDVSEILNEADETCDNDSPKRIAFFKFAQHKQDDDSKEDDAEEDCDDCFPGLLKEDITAISKGIYKINSPKNKRSQYGLETQIEKSADGSGSDASDDGKPLLRVVNGRPANLGEVPYQVAFKMLRSRARKEYVTFCGGVIIGSKKLVTAAHCFEGRRRRQNPCSKSTSRIVPKRELRRTQVVAGNLRNIAKYMEEGQWRSLRFMAYPIRYKFPRQDIAVGYVSRAFTFDAYVNKIPYEKKYTDHGDKVCLVSGYGRINKRQQSDKLLLADLTIRSTQYCTKTHRSNMKKFICTDSVPSDIERGDSGGPLVCSGTLVGIVSGHRYGSGSFFTRVSSYSKYIQRGKATMLTCSHFVHILHVLFIVIFTI